MDKKLTSSQLGGGLSTNDKIDYLKAIAIILVVLGHAMSYYSKSYNVSNFFMMINSIIYSVHVPLFFVISGFLCHEQDKKKFIVKKIKRVLIPFLTFCVLKLIYSNFISSEFVHGNNFFNQFIDAFIFGNLYWFSYSILIMYFVTTLLWNIKDINKRKKIIILSITILMIYSVVSNIFNLSFLPNVFQINKTILHFPYFLFGYYLQLNINNKFEKIYSSKKMYLVITTIIVFCSILYYNGFSPNFILIKYIMSVALFYAISKLVDLFPKNIKILKKIGIYSYQIMLFDSFYKTIIFMIFSHFFDISTISIIIISIVNIILGLISSEVIKKIPYVNILFGLSK